MGKPGLTADRSCSGALSRHIVHRVAMHVPWQKRHFDAVVPKMAKQTFAFPASTRTMFLNWKVKPTAIHNERVRHAKKVQPHWVPTKFWQPGNASGFAPGGGCGKHCRPHHHHHGVDHDCKKHNPNAYCNECRYMLADDHAVHLCVHRE